MNRQLLKIHPARNMAFVPLLVAAIALPTGHAFAFGTQDDQSQTVLHSEFRKLDQNSDQKLSREESSRDKDVAPNFGKADTDGNGVLNAEEYGNFKSAMQQSRVKSYLDDSAVTAQIKAELLRDSGIKGLAIKVETYRGQVILSGFVNDPAQARRAAAIASGIRGVHAVKNSLIVKG